jgi:hypothetical protein
LVISGHDPSDQIVVAQDEGENGNIVTQMLVDPQGADANLGGLGMVAMLYFSEDGRDVTVEYYSTIKNKYYMGVNQFTMTLDLIGEEAPEQPPVQEPEDEKNPDTEAPDDTTTPDNGEGGNNTGNGNEESKGGCGAIVSGSAISLLCLASVSTAALIKRKKRS